MAELSDFDGKSISNSTPIPSEQGLTFNRHDFIQGGGTNIEVSKQGKETGYITSEKVIISSETTSSYESFMTNHFDQLLSQKNIGTTVPDNAGNAVPFLKYLETNHPHEAKILSIIATDDGTKVDNQKLQNFLKTSQGMTIATQLLEDVTAQKLFMLGLSGVKNNPDGKLQVADELHIKLGIDQGKLNKFFEDHPNIEQAYHSGMIKLNAVALTAFGGGWLTSSLSNGEPIAGMYPGAFGMLAGGAAALVGEAVRRTGKSLMKEGVTIDLKRNLDGMKALQQNPQEVAYLKAITGVDMNDFEIVDNAIRVKDISQRVAESNRDPGEVEGEILQGLYARGKFLEDLGINPSKINGTAEQRFMAGRKGSAPSLESEKMGTHWERMIQEEFKPNEGGIRDKFNRKPGEAFFGTGNDARVFIKETIGGTTTFRDPTPAEQDEYKKNPYDAKFQLQSRRIFYIDQSSGELKQWDLKDGPKLGTKGIDFRLEIGDIRPEVDLTLFQNPAAYITLSESFREGFDKSMYSEVKPDNLDTEGNLRRYSEARRRVIEKMTNTFIVKEQELKAKKDQQMEEQRFSKQIAKASEIIDTRIANLQKPETQQERESALNAETTTLTTRNNEIDQRLQELQGSDEKGKKKQDIAIELKTRLNLDIVDIKGIQDEIDRITADLEKTPGGLYEKAAAKEKEVTDLAQQMWKDALDEIKGLPVNVQQRAPMPDYANLLIRAQKQVPDYEKVQRELKAETDKVDKLTEARTQYQNVEVEIAKSNNEKLGGILPQIVGQEQSFDSLTNPAKVSTPISEVDLNTASVEDLATRALTLTDTSGTPLFTDKAAATQAVIKAKTEALVRSRIPTFSAYQTFMNELATNGIVDFEMKTVTEMTDRAEKPISAGGLGWNPADRTTNEQHITNVLKAYQNLNDPSTSVTRYRTSLELEKQYIQGRLKNIETEKVQIKDTIQQEIARLEGYKASLPNIKDVSDRQGELFSEVRDELTQRLEQYISRDAVDAADDKYTPAEKSTKHPKGYYEMLDLIFKYKESPNREQVFTHLNKIMPPKKLALMLQNHLIMPSKGVGDGPTTKKDDLGQIFKYIKANEKGFTASDYRKAMGSIIKDLREEALAFTKI